MTGANGFMMTLLVAMAAQAREELQPEILERLMGVLKRLERLKGR